jgi:hypothetical protein
MVVVVAVVAVDAEVDVAVEGEVDGDEAVAAVVAVAAAVAVVVAAAFDELETPVAGVLLVGLDPLGLPAPTPAAGGTGHGLFPPPTAAAAIIPEFLPRLFTVFVVVGVAGAVPDPPLALASTGELFAD